MSDAASTTTAAATPAATSTSPASTDGGSTAGTTALTATPAAGATATEQPGTTATTTATAADAKPAEGETTKAEGKSEEGAKPAEGAPETYADFATPEGVTLDPVVGAEFKTLAKELNLSQEKAQKVADLGAKMTAKLVADQTTAIKAAHTEWVGQTKTDAEFGGDKLAENLAVAQKAFAAFGTPALKSLLDKTGLGDHPEIVRAFYRAGKTLSEDNFVPAGTASGGNKSAAELFYPSMQKTH